MHMKQVRIKLLVSQSYKLKCNMGVPSPLDVCQELVLPTKIQNIGTYSRYIGSYIMSVSNNVLTNRYKYHTGREDFAIY